jgi:hypothetical protein
VNEKKQYADRGKKRLLQEVFKELTFLQQHK